MPPLTRQAKPLHDLLLAEGVISREQLQSAQAEATRSGHPLKRVIVQEGLLTKHDLLAVVARQSGVTTHHGRRSA